MENLSLLKEKKDHNFYIIITKFRKKLRVEEKVRREPGKISKKLNKIGEELKIAIKYRNNSENNEITKLKG